MNRGIKSVIGTFAGFLLSFLVYTILWNGFAETVLGTDKRIAWYVLLICLVLPTATGAVCAAWETDYPQQCAILAYKLVLMSLALNVAVFLVLLVCGILAYLRPGALATVLRVLGLLGVTAGPVWYIYDRFCKRYI